MLYQRYRAIQQQAVYTGSSICGGSSLLKVQKQYFIRVIIAWAMVDVLYSTYRPNCVSVSNAMRRNRLTVYNTQNHSPPRTNFGAGFLQNRRGTHTTKISVFGRSGRDIFNRSVTWSFAPSPLSRKTLFFLCPKAVLLS